MYILYIMSNKNEHPSIISDKKDKIEDIYNSLLSLNLYYMCMYDTEKQRVVKFYKDGIEESTYRSTAHHRPFLLKTIFVEIEGKLYMSTTAGESWIVVSDDLIKNHIIEGKKRIG